MQTNSFILYCCWTAVSLFTHFPKFSQYQFCFFQSNKFDNITYQFNIYIDNRSLFYYYLIKLIFVMGGNCQKCLQTQQEKKYELFVPYTTKPEKVFDRNNDNRVEAPLVYPHPWSAIGIICFTQSGKRGHGTGFMIHKNVVLTAAHNLYSDKINAEMQNVQFILGVNGLNGQECKIKQFYIPEQYKNNGRLELDYGILILKEDVEKNKIIEVDWDGLNIGNVTIAGYPQSIYRQNKEIKAETKIYRANGECMIDEKNRAMLRYKIDTSGGQSGSPIMIQKENGTYKAVGIHTCSQYHFNKGILLTKKVQQQIQQWLLKERIIQKQWLVQEKIETEIKNYWKGKKIFGDGHSYDGEWLNGEKSGKGTEKYPSGDFYEGQFKKNKNHGEGTYFYMNGNKFEGLWENGLRQKGTFIKSNGDKLQVVYSYKPNGEVIQQWSNGDKYEGQMKDEKRNGHGTYYWANGNRYQGEWKNDKMEGNGTYYYASGSRYQGEFKNDKMEGHGTYHLADGRKWEGQWKDDKQHGKGIYYKVNGDKFEQFYENGVRKSSKRI